MRKVLFIESEKDLQIEIEHFLSNKGFETVIAENSTAAIQKAMEFLPDIILCNSEIEPFSGYEVHNTLKQINSTAIIPFIFMIGKSKNEYARYAMNLGADGYLKKPFTFNDLLFLIEARLKKQEKIMGLADEKFNTLMDFSSNGLFIYCDRQLKYINKKFCNMLGYSRKDLLGMNLINFVYKDDISTVADKMDKEFQGIFKDQEISFRIITKEDEILTLTVQFSLVSLHGKNSIIGTVLDKNNQNKLAQKSGLTDHVERNITKREKEILYYICEGMTNKEIGELLNISERTVEGHRINLLNKTNSRNSATLAIYAVKNNLYQIK